MNKKHNKFGGDHRGGDFAHKDFNRPAFHGNNSGGGRDFGGRSAEMFEAVCASCSKKCEVPFRPNGKKPVYCKECFAANGGPAASPRGNSDRFAPRRDFSHAPAQRSEYRSERPAAERTPNVDTGELKRSLEAMNAKLDRLVQILSDKAPAPKAAPVQDLAATVAKVTAKPAPKKAAPAKAKKPAPKKKK